MLKIKTTTTTYICNYHHIIVWKVVLKSTYSLLYTYLTWTGIKTVYTCLDQNCVFKFHQVSLKELHLERGFGDWMPFLSPDVNQLIRVFREEMLESRSLFNGSWIIHLHTPGQNIYESSLVFVSHFQTLLSLNKQVSIKVYSFIYLFDIGRTPFIQAGIQMSFEMVKTILPFVSDVNVTDRDGMTALHCVSSAYPPTKTQLDIMSMLLDAGANIRHCDNGGRTALHMAAAAGNAVSAEILISHGAELEVKEKLLGETPLNMASAYNRDEVIHLLLKNGANVNTTDQDQMSPLHKVQISRGLFNIIKSQKLELNKICL